MPDHIAGNTTSIFLTDNIVCNFLFIPQNLTPAYFLHFPTPREWSGSFRLSVDTAPLHCKPVHAAYS
ncbi:MAG: hypothetical protein ACRC13_01205 [Tannerellaceae bacterium]